FPGGLFNEWYAREWSALSRVLDTNTLRSSTLSGRIFVRGVRPADSDRDHRLLDEAVRDHRGNLDVYAATSAPAYREEVAAALGLRGGEAAVAAGGGARSSAAALDLWGSWLDGTSADTVIRRFQSEDDVRRGIIGPWSHGARYDASPFQANGGEARPR